MSVAFSPSACRKMDSNRRLWRGFTPPCRRCLIHFPRARPGKWTLTDTSEEALHGQAAPEPKSCQFLIVLLLFWPLLEGQFDFIFFCLLAVRPNKQKAPNRHLPKQTDTCPNRQTPPNRHLPKNHKKIKLCQSKFCNTSVIEFHELMQGTCT